MLKKPNEPHSDSPNGMADSSEGRRDDHVATAPVQWQVRLYRDSADCVFADFTFPTEDGRNSHLHVPVSLVRSPKKLLDAMADRLPAFPPAMSGDDGCKVDFMRSLVAAAHDSVVWMPTRTGFHDPTTFVSHDEIITAVDRKTRHRPEQLAHPVRTGTAAGERDGVLRLAKRSTYVSFAIGVALAGPMLSYVRQPAKSGRDVTPLLKETATFNFCGPSSAGKSSVLESALSIVGTISETVKLDFTARGLAEWADANNDLIVVCDDAEEGNHLSPERQVAQFQNLAHMIPSGSYKLISKGSGNSPVNPLTWSLFNLTSSLDPISTLSSRYGWTMSPGDKVRLFDIPVPDSKLGGIFDLNPQSQAANGVSGNSLIGKLTSTIAQNRGNTFPLWIQFLLKEDRADEIRQLTSKFVKSAGPHANGWETRFAEKFAVIYAAMKLAVRAGILPWRPRHPYKVAQRCYILARAAVHEAKLTERPDTTLRGLLSDASGIVDANGNGNVLALGAEVVAIRFRKRNRRYLGLLDSVLKQRLGHGGRGRLIQELREMGLLEPGAGHAGTSQVRVPVLSGGNLVKRPRLWVMRANKVRAYLRS